MGDGVRELLAVDEILAENVLHRETLSVACRSTEKLLDMLTDRDTCFVDEVVMELAGVNETEVDSEYVTVLEADDDADVVRVIDVDDAGLWLPVVDTLSELLLDSDVLCDGLRVTFLVIDDDSDTVPVVVRDNVAL